MRPEPSEYTKLVNLFSVRVEAYIINCPLRNAVIDQNFFFLLSPSIALHTLSTWIVGDSLEEEMCNLVMCIDVAAVGQL